jgi:hypothetical protein
MLWNEAEEVVSVVFFIFDDILMESNKQILIINWANIINISENEIKGFSFCNFSSASFHNIYVYIQNRHRFASTQKDHTSSQKCLPTIIIDNTIAELMNPSS